MKIVMGRILSFTFGLQQVEIAGIILYDWAALVFFYLAILDLFMKRKIKLGRMPILIISIFIFLFAMAASLMRVSIEWPELFSSEVLEVTRILIGICIMFSTILSVKSYSEVVMLLQWMVFGASFSFILVLPEFLSGFLFGDFSSSAWLGSRFIGMFNCPNYFSIYAASMSGLAFGFLLFKGVQRNIPVKVASLIVASLGPIYIMASGSRGGFLALGLLTLGLLIAWKALYKLRTALLLVVICLLPLFVLPSFFENVIIQHTFSRLGNPLGLQDRHNIWPVVFDVISSNLVIGVGFWPLAELVHSKIGFYNISHNTVLQVLASLGILGIVSLMLVMIEFLKVSTSLKRRCSVVFYLLMVATLPAFLGALVLDFLQVRWVWFLGGLWLSTKGYKMDDKVGLLEGITPPKPPKWR